MSKQTISYNILVQIWLLDAPLGLPLKSARAACSRRRANFGSTVPIPNTGILKRYNKHRFTSDSLFYTHACVHTLYRSCMFHAGAHRTGINMYNQA